MRGIYIVFVIIYCNSFKNVLTAENGCEEILPYTNTAFISGEDSSDNPVIIGEEDEGTFVALLINPANCELDNDTILYIVDSENGTVLATFENYELENMTAFVLFSFTNIVRLYVEGINASVNIYVDYAVLNHSSLVVFEDISNYDLLDVYGNDNCTIVNYRKTWVMSPGTDNSIHYYIVNQTLDDQMGDYLAIGPGAIVFENSPSMMISGTRTNFPVVDVYGNFSYVHLFTKMFTSDIGFCLFYNTSLYVPPTKQPPPTIPPPATLNATIAYDKDTEDPNEFVYDFITTVSNYATKTCEQNKDNVTLIVNITKIVDVDPCVVVVYFIDIINGSCQGNKSFSVDSYNRMMTNYSTNITNDFKSLGPDCPGSNTAWIIAVTIVIFIALVVTLVACCSRNNLSYKRLTQKEDPVTEVKVTPIEKFDEIENELDIRNITTKPVFRLPSISHTNPAFIDDEPSTSGFSSEHDTVSTSRTNSDPENIYDVIRHGDDDYDNDANDDDA